MTETIRIFEDHCKCGKIKCLKSLKTQKNTRITDYDYFINAKSKQRIPSALREIMNTIRTMPPHSIIFGTGVPNVNTYPFIAISIKLKDGSNFKIEGKDLENALQYLPTVGHTPLVKQLQDLQDKTHGLQDWSQQGIMVTCGATESMAAVFDMVLNNADPIIVHDPLYPATADVLKPFCPQYIALEQDRDGVKTQELRRTLEEMVRQNKTLPKLMYLNPEYGCNLYGTSFSTECKRELYRIACEYNLLVLEDDPFYPLQFSEEMSPSLLSMDVEGRVIRLDSFSKTLSSGLRVGYVTGPSQLIRRLELHVQVTTLHTSGISQVLVSKLLDHWGFDKYFSHIEKVKLFYEERRDLILAACNRHLKGLAEWEVPPGGTLLWLKVPVMEDTWSLAIKHCLGRGLLIVPGHPFTRGPEPHQYNYIRLSFTLPTASQTEEGIKLLAEIIQELMKIKERS